ncbi:synergin gamma isoform X17 [Peromyscus californicus insignis]|uniref:synergin gamma isoform X17 n=1 Tax=Peromyscus californicus insignis TaxID=564181 RepID=UPI0022A709F8|nr:synergin gamma isoform X17 [Peromyscus californicus insignis]
MHRGRAARARGLWSHVGARPRPVVGPGLVGRCLPRKCLSSADSCWHGGGPSKMALRPGAGASGAAGAGAGPGGAGSFMFPVAGGMRPPQGLMPVQQQGFPMVSVMQPSMQGMMGMNYSSQMSQGPIAMQAGIPMGPMPAAGMPFLGQPPFLGMRPPGPQYTPDMQKQFAEEQQKRFEQQQKLLEEERKRRQFEEQKQKLRLLSSVKPKTGEKNRDDALEAIKGNLDGFSRDAKMHPTPASHPKKPGVGVFPSQDPVQPRMPPWIYNESLVPDAYKKILETTMTPTGIDTAKLYPILMSSGLPRETLGQIWALANRTTPGKLTKEELYTVLAMVAVTQRGVPAMSPDALNQFPAAPIPTLSGFPMTLPTPVSQPTAMPSVPAGSMPLSLGQPIMGINLVGPVGGAAAPTSSGFMPAYPSNQVGKTEEDDFQDFQDASKSGSLDDSFTDFQEVSASSKTSNSQHGNSAPSLLTPLSGTKASTDKYSVFKGISADKPSENAVAFGESGDKYSAFRELEQTTESKPLGECFAEFRSTGTDDGFTDFKTADSVSPLEPPPKDTFPAAFPSGAAQQKQTQVKTPLNLADLDMFSSANCSGEKPVPFSAAFSTSKSVSTRPPAAGSAAASAALASTKTSSLVDDFGEFNLFGEYSNPASAGEQDDFADFMAFGNSSISSEPKVDDKYDVLREEVSPSSLASSTVESAQNPPAASSKYDVFKQLSLEGAGLAMEEFKENTPSAKSDDDFADFHSSKFSSTSSDKSLGEKAVAFRHAKEDSASVKSLDLPSIGGSSVGKEDSEDALSVQFDMKLADVGGDLKHVMSDSSLDLPTVSGQHPPAAGMALASEDALPETPFPAFASFKDMMPQTIEQKEYESGDYQDFTRQDLPTVDRSQETTCPSPASSVASHETPKECADDFGEFQSEKPKISKFDFLVANSQSKMKSSEEMIKNELATFDLSVQGSHKRSLSLGDKEISRSSPSPALEQPFRDRSNTLSEKTALPVIRDKYKDLTGEVEENERYAYEWQRCLGSALDVIKKANDTLNGISSSAVCTEVIQSAQGMEYLLGVVEVYRVTRRVELGIKATAVCCEKLQQLLKDIDKVWNNLIGFMSLATLTPDENSLDFSSCMLRPGIKNAQELACGVCLLNVDSRSRKEEKPAEEQPKKAFNSETDSFKLAYGGHQYHASCANFWINCVEPKPPGLLLPDLL